MSCVIDTVTIKYGCRDCNFVIKKVTIRGSAAPCTSLLVVGKRSGPAKRCLIKNGYVLVSNHNHVYCLKRKRFLKPRLPIFL